MLKDLLRQLRKDKGLNQIDLAQRVGVSIDSVRRWEAGKREPRLGELEKIALVLEVPVASLINGAEVGAVENKTAPFPKEERGISNIQFDNIDYKVYSFSVYNYSLMRGEEYPTMDSRAGNCFHTTEKLSGLDKDRPPFIVDQDKDFRMKRTANFEPTDRILVDPLQTKIESGKIYLVSYQGESIVCQIRKNSEGQYQLINDGQPINATLDDLTARRLIVVGKVVSRWTEYYTG